MRNLKRGVMSRSLTMDLTFIFTFHSILFYFHFSFYFILFCFLFSSIFRTTQVRAYQLHCHISHKLMA